MNDDTSNNMSIVSKLFDGLNESKISWVITHDFQNFPEGNKTNKVNLLVDSNSFTSAVEICNELGLSTKEQYYGVLQKYLSDPVRNTKRVVRSPLYISKRVFEEMTQPAVVESDSHNRTVDKIVFDETEPKIILNNHLGYPPLMPEYGGELRINPTIEQGMLESRVFEKSLFYRPQPRFELIHLICEGIFDYRSDFPTLHKNRCDYLWDDINTNQARVDEFTTLLSKVFFDADKVVLDEIGKSNYDALLSKLVSFKDY